METARPEITDSRLLVRNGPPPNTVGQGRPTSVPDHRHHRTADLLQGGVACVEIRLDVGDEDGDDPWSAAFGMTTAMMLRVWLPLPDLFRMSQPFGALARSNLPVTPPRLIHSTSCLREPGDSASPRSSGAAFRSSRRGCLIRWPTLLLYRLVGVVNEEVPLKQLSAAQARQAGFAGLHHVQIGLLIGHHALRQRRFPPPPTGSPRPL